MEVEARVPGRGTDEVVLTGGLPIVTQGLIPEVPEPLPCTGTAVAPRFCDRRDRPSPSSPGLMFQQRRGLSNACQTEGFRLCCI